MKGIILDYLPLNPRKINLQRLNLKKKKKLHNTATNIKILIVIMDYNNIAVLHS